MRIAQFPTATDADVFTPTEIKKLFYHAMQNCWQTNFVNLGQNVHQTSLNDLRTYMVKQESQTDAHCKKVRDTNKKNQMKKSFNKNYKSYKYYRRYTSSSNKNNDSKENKNSRVLLSDDDCPIHGASHKWGQSIKTNMATTFAPSAPTPLNPILSNLVLSALCSITDHPIRSKSMQTNDKSSH